MKTEALAQSFAIGTTDGVFTPEGKKLYNMSRPISAAVATRDEIAFVVDDREVWRIEKGEGRRIAMGDSRINCIAAAAGELIVGTERARVARVVGGKIEYLENFDRLDGRSEWNTPWGGPPDVRSLAISSSQNIYVDIHVGWIVRSSDRGATWTECRNGLEKDVHQVATHPDRDETVLAATATGFYISNDSGENFVRGTEPMAYYYQRACACFPGSETVLVSTSRGPHGDAGAKLYRTTDLGSTWNEVIGLPSEIRNNIDTFHLCTTADGRVLVCADNVLYASDDYGESFERIEFDAGTIRVLIDTSRTESVVQ